MSRRKAPPLATSEPCCPQWSSIIGGFYWFALEEYPDVLAMPCLIAGDTRYRVNHCPICGSPCREAVTTRAAVEAARGPT